MWSKLAYLCYPPFLYWKTLDLSRFFKIISPENNYNLCFFYTLVSISIDCFNKQYNVEEQQQQQTAALAEAATTATAAVVVAAAAAVEEKKKLKWQETFAVLHKDVLLI